MAGGNGPWGGGNGPEDEDDRKAEGRKSIWMMYSAWGKSVCALSWVGAAMAAVAMAVARVAMAIGFSPAKA